jgi:hypothetical protein
MAIPKGHKQNFNTLVEAFRAGDVALMECQLTATGEIVAVICAVSDPPASSRSSWPWVSYRRAIGEKRRP